MILAAGFAVANKPIPDEHHVLRYAAWGRLRRDEDGQVIGILPQALRLRDKEPYLSVTWVEFFQGNRNGKIANAITATRASIGIKAQAKGIFALGNVAALHKTCKSQAVSAQVLHKKTASNPGHSGIYGLDKAENNLLSLLADEVFSELYP